MLGQKSCLEEIRSIQVSTRSRNTLPQNNVFCIMFALKTNFKGMFFGEKMYTKPLRTERTKTQSKSPSHF